MHVALPNIAISNKTREACLIRFPNIRYSITNNKKIEKSMSEFFSKNVIINKRDTILMQGNGIFLLVSKGSKYLLTPTSLLCKRGNRNYHIYPVSSLHVLLLNQSDCLVNVFHSNDFDPTNTLHAIQRYFWHNTRLKSKLLRLCHPLFRHIYRTDFST